MCGIVGYLGSKRADTILLTGLQRLEYRGYDSAGIAILNGDLKVRKQKGKVSALADQVESSGGYEGSLGIGHTRWATHGFPNDVNAHPHQSESGDFALVHNGIIENYAALKKTLQAKGYTFKSETDTEVLVHLIDDIRKQTDLGLVESVQQALTQVDGTYGIGLVSKADGEDLLIGARKGSPLIIGVGEGEWFLASDAAPLVEHTKQVIYLNDGEMVVITREGYEVMTTENTPLRKEVIELEMDVEAVEKSGYDYFMLKEIMEQPQSIADAMRGRIDPETGTIKLGGLIDIVETLQQARRIIICACGTSWHAGLVGEYLIEDLARIPVEVEYASEFRYRDPILREGDVVFVISQSGETADTLAAVRQARQQDIPVIGIVNTVGSTIARETDAGVYLHAGPEIGVASTKAFTAQVTVLTMIALKLAEGRTVDEGRMKELLAELAQIPSKIERVLGVDEQVEQIAREVRLASNFLYLGRGYNFPVALEGALKLKEISYIHAEGYPAAEMKHGPIALIDRFMPVVVIAMKDATYEKVVSNIEEVVARNGSVIAITDEGNDELDELCEHVIKVPSTPDMFDPLVTVVPLQLLSYHVAVMRGCDVDQPRNLAKSVTVE
jgi:glucosamine--fructose-6-phosphate aminotransferase (isomerizing)